jgi:hypothetical protein
MNLPVKKNVLRALLFLGLLGLAVPSRSLPAAVSQASGQTPEALFSQIQEAFQKKDFEGYLGLFTPDERALEQTRLQVFFNDFKMTSVRIRLAGTRTSGDGQTRLFLQAFYNNSYACMIENWQLRLASREGRWEIAEKTTTGNLKNLYKLRIPDDRTERAVAVEIIHHDIRLSFKEAAVFYDNIPDLDTALLVVGKGLMRFTPSDAIEKHQMELLYKKPFLEDDIDYVYVRCSPGYFASNIAITPGAGLPAVTQVERDKASSIFARNYSRSFTIQNSLDGEILSLLPQSDEAVFEFKGRRAGELTYIYYPFSDDEVNLYDRIKDRVISLYTPVEEGAPPAKKFYLSFEEKFDIDSYELDMSYSPAQSYLSAKARIRVVSKVEALDSLKFRFGSEFEILRITDEDKRELFYTQDKLRKNLYVYFINRIGRSSGTWVEIYYRGRMTPPLPTTDAARQSAYPDKLIFKPRYETYFFSQAGNWYPGPAEEDYFMARLRLIVPPDYKCVASGELVERGRWSEMGNVVDVEKAGSSTYTFESRNPVKYMSFIVGRFDRDREWKDPVPIQTYFSQDVPVKDTSVFAPAKDILDFYVKSFGPFPYEKLGIVQRLWPEAGGYSPASFIVLNKIPWADDQRRMVDSPVNLSRWPEYFLAHEIAHQWWGQGVSFLTYKDQWLSEGLSQFAAAFYLRQKYGERDFASILKKFSQWTGKKSAKGPISLGSRLSFNDFSAYQTIVYDKAALALFMLRDLLGEETFLSGLRAFFDKYKYSAVRTKSFVTEMEKTSGRNLQEFFKGWFYSYRLPEVQVIWSQEPSPDGGRLTIRITQIGERFVFPLWIEWTSGGSVHRDMVVVDQSRQEAVLHVPGKVDRVRVNPDKAVPGKFF